MYTYSFAAEFLALIISMIIFVFTNEKKETITKLRRIFRSAVVLNIISICINLLTLYDMAFANVLPRWLNYLVNSCYYAVCFVITGLYCTYLFKKLLCHVYEENVVAKFFKCVAVLVLSGMVMLVMNYPLGIIFSFTADNQYIHGPLWSIGYIHVAIVLVLLMICFRRYYNRIDYEGKKLLTIGIPVVFLLFVFQIVYPDVLLNGTIGAFVACLCYLCFESHLEAMDAVTKLGSLSAFLRRLDNLENGGEVYQIIVVNLRNFGNINTTYGFTKGNEILYNIANWIQNDMADGEVYRIAPISFAVVLPFHEKYENRLSDRIQKLCEEFPRSMDVGKRICRINPFFVELISDGKNKEGGKILEALEYGVRIAKNEELEMLAFDKKMQVELERKKYLSSYIQKAMAEQRFEMWYQPILCTENGRFCSAEALMRLKDEEGNFISPDEFIPLAEEMGVIAEISNQTLKKVANLMEDAEELGIWRMSVNLSTQQLQSRNFLEDLEKLNADTEKMKQRFSYEVTERIMLGREPLVRENLRKMTENGYTLVMDDFGTGYSNFTVVLEYPFDKIKIDKSILYSSEREHYKMIEMLVQLFHAYGKKVVVEGVETKEQVDELCRLQVDYIQGFYYAKPMSEEEYRKFQLENQNR